MRPTPEHEKMTSKWAVQKVLQGVLIVLWLITYAVMMYGVHADRWFGGTHKGQAFQVMLMTGLPFFIAYFPLRFVGTRMLQRALDNRPA